MVMRCCCCRRRCRSHSPPPSCAIVSVSLVPISDPFVPDNKSRNALHFRSIASRTLSLRRLFQFSPSHADDAGKQNQPENVRKKTKFFRSLSLFSWTACHCCRCFFPFERANSTQFMENDPKDENCTWKNINFHWKNNFISARPAQRQPA